MNPLKYFWGVLGLKSYSCQLEGRDEGEVLGPVYGSTSVTLGEFVREQNFVHRWFKGLLAYPFVWFVAKFFSGYLIRKPAAGYTLARIMDDAFEKTLVESNELYKYNLPKFEKRSLASLRRDYGCGIAVRLLRNLKCIYFSVILRDSFYLEFHNMLMLNISKGVVDYYGKDPHHVLFAGTQLNDPAYWLFKQMKEGRGLVKAEPRKR